MRHYIFLASALLCLFFSTTYAQSSGTITLRATVTKSDTISTTEADTHFQNLDQTKLDQVSIAKIDLNTAATEGYTVETESQNNGFLVDEATQEKIAYDLVMMDVATQKSVDLTRPVGILPVTDPMLIKRTKQQYLLCINTQNPVSFSGFAEDMVTVTYTNL